jgi:hypothetical protein
MALLIWTLVVAALGGIASAVPTCDEVFTHFRIYLTFNAKVIVFCYYIVLPTYFLNCWQWCS